MPGRPDPAYSSEGRAEASAPCASTVHDGVNSSSRRDFRRGDGSGPGGNGLALRLGIECLASDVLLHVRPRPSGAIGIAGRSSTGLRLRVFGEFALSSGGREVAVSGLKSRALLAFLACNTGKPQSRDKLIGLLWSERFEDQARQSLRHVLSALRKLLGPDILVTDRDLVHLDQVFQSDVSQFVALISTDDRDHLRDAIDLYNDDLLTSFSLPEKAFTDWLAAERIRLHNLAIGALETLMDRSQGNLHSVRLLHLAQRAVLLDPYREHGHRQMLHALALMGRRNEALVHYRRLEQTLQVELGVRPEAETRELFEAVRSGAICAASRASVSTHSTESSLGAPDLNESSKSGRKIFPGNPAPSEGASPDPITPSARRPMCPARKPSGGPRLIALRRKGPRSPFCRSQT